MREYFRMPFLKPTQRDPKSGHGGFAYVQHLASCRRTTTDIAAILIRLIQEVLNSFPQGTLHLRASHLNIEGAAIGNHCMGSLGTC